MVNMLAYENKKEILKDIVTTTRSLIAYYSEDMWNLESISEMDLLRQYFADRPIVDLACYDVSRKESIEFLRKVRSDGYEKTLLMLLADAKMSPMEYIKPEILASELLIKPYTKEQLKNKLRDLLEIYCSKVTEDTTEDVFVLETKDGKTRIPFHQIYYFEAREKKIFVRTLKTEYPFYQTLDELEENLPEGFVRCHRSYIVNWKQVEKVDLSNGELHLAQGLYLPFSRKYKDKLKNLR